LRETAVADTVTEQRIPGYCALCISRCGSIARVEDGRFVALEPDPSTRRKALREGRAAPELVTTGSPLYPRMARPAAPRSGLQR